MYSTLWQITCDEVDLSAAGHQCRDRLELDLSRFLAFRARQPEDRVFDLWFDEMERDSIGPVERMYAWLGTPFLPETRRALERWLIDNAREKRPPHRYTFETFGLSKDDLLRRFADYRAKYILPRE
jgi:hypothetical protein